MSCAEGEEPDWTGWSAFDAAPGRPLRDVDRATAERYFHVLSGLSSWLRRAQSRYHVDPERLVGTHGHRLIAGNDEPQDIFVLAVRGAIAAA